MANSAEFVLQQIVAAAEVCGPGLYICLTVVYSPRNHFAHARPLQAQAAARLQLLLVGLQTPRHAQVLLAVRARVVRGPVRGPHYPPVHVHGAVRPTSKTSKTISTSNFRT